MVFQKTELRKADRTVGVDCNIFYPRIKYITVNPNRKVSLSKQFFQAFTFADQILPGSVFFICPLALSHFPWFFSRFGHK